MDHKAFLSSLEPEDRQRLTALNDARGLVHLMAHFGAISLCGVLIFYGVPFWPLIMVAQGVLLVFLFTLLHETSHKTPFKTAWINDVVGHICGLVLFLPANWFRYFHLAHHRFTQIPGKDPELAAAKPVTLWQFIIHVSGIPVWLSHVKTLMRNVRGTQFEEFVPKKGRIRVKTEARIYLLAYLVLFWCSWLWGASTLIYVWLVPMLVGQPFLRLYLLAEHGRCPTVANMLENTRTTYTNLLVRAIAWNMPYHTEHHCYPSVPFHKLPELHELIQPHLRVTAKSYTAFNAEYVRKSVDRSAN